jgi:hypothetical protein
MKTIAVTLAAAGLAVVFAAPAKAEPAANPQGARNGAQVEHTDISAQRRYYRRHYGYRYAPYRYRGPRYGYYRPYRYYRPYYGPGVSFGFGGGPRLGVWF